MFFIDLNKAKGNERITANPDLHFVHGDVTSSEIWEKVLSLAEKEYGRLDIVVNNAGKFCVIPGS